MASTDFDWNSDVWIETPSAERTLLIVQSTFMLLITGGLLLVSIGICFLRRSRSDALKPLPVKGTLAAMLSMAAGQACNFAYHSVAFRAHYAKQTFNVAQIIGEFCTLAAYCFIFSTFYRLINVFCERVTKISAPKLSIVKYVHFGILALFVLLCMADWGYYVAYIDSMVKRQSSDGHRKGTWENIDSVRWIVFWVSAVEISGWSVFLGLMTSRDGSYLRYKMSIFLLVASSGCFLGLNFLWFIWDILAFLQSSSEDDGHETFSDDVTGPGKTARQIIVFTFIQGLSLGLLLCYWRFPIQGSQNEDSELGQNLVVSRTGLVLSEVERSRKSPRITERAASGELAEVDPIPCSRPHNSEVAELMANSEWHSKQNDRLLEADGSNPILEADSRNVH